MGNIAPKRKSIFEVGEDVNFDHFQVLRAIGKGSFGKGIGVKPWYALTAPADLLSSGQFKHQPHITSLTVRVCIVQKKSNDNYFAMKYMNKSQCEAKDAVPNVFREIEILAALDHPFLVNLWFSFQDEEDMFMVVDLLLGGDLRYHIQQNIPFSDEAVRLFILEVGSALDYLHKRNIIHRDIKPDNLLLDDEGHVHLTDFNIATVLKSDHLATSMSGTKPYMAPEVFECACECCDGYAYHIDWWSLGVTAYEVRRGKRPYDIHSTTPLSEIRIMFLDPPKYPIEWSQGFIQLMTKLLTVSPSTRASSLEALLKIPFTSEFTNSDIIEKRIPPLFTPPKDHLNCDPTFELEEMIIESKPLHKKKKRLLKQKSLRESQPNLIAQKSSNNTMYDKMLIFNREREAIRKAKEKKEREWQEELDRSMSMSDPIGQGSSYCGRKLSFKCKRSSKQEESSKDGVLGTLITASAKSLSATIGPIQGYKPKEGASEDLIDNNLTRNSKLAFKESKKSACLESKIDFTLPIDTNRAADSVPTALQKVSVNKNSSDSQKSLLKHQTSLPECNGKSSEKESICDDQSKKILKRPDDDDLEQTHVSTVDKNLEEVVSDVKSSEFLPLKESVPKPQYKKVVSLNESKRSQSFIMEPNARHEKYLPVRNSCDFHIQELKLTLRENVALNKAIQNTIQKPIELREKKRIKCISLQSSSSSPLFTTSLEYIRNSSSSGSLSSKVSKHKVETPVKSSSDDSQLHDQTNKILKAGISTSKVKEDNSSIIGPTVCETREKILPSASKFTKTSSSQSLQLASLPAKCHISYRRAISNDSTQVQSLKKINIQQASYKTSTVNASMNQSALSPVGNDQNAKLLGLNSQLPSVEAKSIVDDSKEVFKAQQTPVFVDTKNDKVKSMIFPNELTQKEP